MSLTYASIATVFLFILSCHSSCQIRTGLFHSEGAHLFGTQYGSGNVSLFYKMHIPSDIDTDAQNYDMTNNTPVILLVHGSGALNHDEFIPVDGTTGFGTFRDIAQGLCSKHNTIVFTYDKRSCNPYSIAPCSNNLPPWCVLEPDANPCFDYTKLTYLDFVSDAIFAMQFIQQTFAFINPSNIIPTGHSQGASIVPMVSSYLNLSSCISLMGTGLPIDEVILYQERELNSSTLEHDLVTFTMIKNGSYSGWDAVQILGSSTSAIFWKQWLDAEADSERLKHLKLLSNILTINSDTDWNVPPLAYVPLHELIDIVSGNQTHVLFSTMVVFPALIHQMVNVDDFIANNLNVSDEVIATIGTWVNSVYGSKVDTELMVSSLAPSLSPTKGLVSPIDLAPATDDTWLFVSIVFMCLFGIALCIIGGFVYKTCSVTKGSYKNVQISEV
eukprot:1007349_1